MCTCEMISFNINIDTFAPSPLATLVFGNDARLCFITSCLRSDVLPEYL